jgi:DNA-binding MarR family transcriptional regulator
MLGKTDVETDTAQAAPDGATAALDPLTLVKLAEDPCWFSFRINYLANHFNVPCYGWVADEFGLSRPEFVVLYSLALRGGVAAKNIVQSSGFPKNTISRAVQRLLRLKLVARATDAGDRRSFVLRLTPSGRRMVDAAMAPMRARQEIMLASLAPGERRVLSDLLGRLVVVSATWPNQIDTSLSEGEEP